jgi:hypothetical protein
MKLSWYSVVKNLRKTFTPKPLEHPEKDSQWHLPQEPEDKSPWCETPSYYPPVTIIDAKEGWVRYKMGSGLMFNDERMKLSTFLRLYKKVTV